MCEAICVMNWKYIALHVDRHWDHVDINVQSCVLQGEIAPNNRDQVIRLNSDPTRVERVHL